MPQIWRTRESLRDYQDIWDFIAQDNEGAADRVLRSFDARLTTLASEPFAARQIEHLAPRLRCSPVGNYVIFFRPEADGIALIRVLHARRDITPEIFQVV